MIKFLSCIGLAVLFQIPFAIIEMTCKDKDEAVHRLVTVGIFYSFFIALLLAYFAGI